MTNVKYMKTFWQACIVFGFGLNIYPLRGSTTRERQQVLFTSSYLKTLQTIKHFLYLIVK
jgi:hypothetical protein